MGSDFFGEGIERIALVAGTGRRAGTGTVIAKRLEEDGWTGITAHWPEYDRRMPWGADETVPGMEAKYAFVREPAGGWVKRQALVADGGAA
ncbi:hypothetical protein [Amycolatopsis benzoatilytica]|uniref:hypothetical protein n=1 Tax=Amycolatopsis benzoatilytica TaxID=346045 RepID=UPI00035DC921|nr:hypothetical protein [Amycolatopsis benzoatilytica]